MCSGYRHATVERDASARQELQDIATMFIPPSPHHLEPHMPAVDRTRGSWNEGRWQTNCSTVVEHPYKEQCANTRPSTLYLQLLLSLSHYVQLSAKTKWPCPRRTLCKHQVTMSNCVLTLSNSYSSWSIPLSSISFSQHPTQNPWQVAERFGALCGRTQIQPLCGRTQIQPTCPKFLLPVNCQSWRRSDSKCLNLQIIQFPWISCLCGGGPINSRENLFEMLGTPVKTCLQVTGTPVKTCMKFWQWSLF